MIDGLGEVSVMRRRGMRPVGVARDIVANARAGVDVAEDGALVPQLLTSGVGLRSIRPADASDIRCIDDRFWYWIVLNFCGDGNCVPFRRGLVCA